MNTKIIAGVDEAGRGPLAGPVVAAAVIFKPNSSIAGLADSKKLSSKKREILAQQIQQQCFAYAVGEASVEEIDSINIHQATLLAMKRAVESLHTTPDEAWIDGLYAPHQLDCECKTFVKGDSLHDVISAASIIAKVTRDKLMEQYELRYPGYGFLQHKGYPTKQHINALQNLGVSEVHRRSYGPVKSLLNTHETLD